MRPTLAGIAKQVALGGAAILLLYEVATVALAGSAHLRGDEALALRIRPQSALVTATQTALREGKPVVATNLARQALLASPLDQDALATLALARAQQGDPADADRMMQLAAFGGWRNPAVQVWLIEAALKHRDGAVAVLRADALLRQGHFSDPMIGVLRRLAADRSTGTTLAGRLAESPNWRGHFLTGLGSLTPADYDAHERLLMAMQSVGSELRPEETNAYLSLLIAGSEPERALRVWQKIRGRSGDPELLEDARLAHLVDLAESSSPFSWVSSSAPGLSVTPSNGEPAGVELSLDGAGAVKALEQTLVLPPGRYSLQMRWASDNAGTGPSLRSTLVCSGGSELPHDARTRTFPKGLRVTAGTMVVPREGCRAQKLGIWLDSDRPDAATVTLENVSLRREQ